VDAETGKPLPIKIESLDDYDDRNDPFLVWRGHWITPDEMEIEWNVAIHITVTSDGYEEKTVQLTDALPKRLAIPLARSKPTTQPSPYPSSPYPWPLPPAKKRG
jgi:hypothetical protein